MTTLAPAYTSGAESAKVSSWLNLYQQPLSEIVQKAGTVDLVDMWYQVLSGQSARKYVDSDCPATIDENGVVTIPLDFWVFPSELTLNYQLSAGIGEISEPVLDTISREVDLVFDYSASQDLDFIIESLSHSFETAAYDSFSQVIATPALTFDGYQVQLSHSCWCVVRLKVAAKGWRHRVTMQLQKYEQQENEDGELNWTGYKIENIDNSIQATWLDNGELQSAELDLVIPPCVEDYLATCDDGEIKSLISQDGESHYMVWYSTCTGRVLRARKVK